MTAEGHEILGSVVKMREGRKGDCGNWCGTVDCDNWC